MKFSDVATVIDKLYSAIDEYKDRIPDELLKKLEKETNTLALLLLDNMKAKITEQYAEDASKFMHSFVGNYNTINTNKQNN